MRQAHKPRKLFKVVCYIEKLLHSRQEGSFEIRDFEEIIHPLERILRYHIRCKAAKSVIQDKHASRAGIFIAQTLTKSIDMILDYGRIQCYLPLREEWIQGCSSPPVDIEVWG